MNTENLSTLKIHKLTQAQYDRELEAGRIDDNALYLTPNDVYLVATEFADGLMGCEDKAKLNGMELSTISEVKAYLGI